MTRKAALVLAVPLIAALACGPAGPVPLAQDPRTDWLRRHAIPVRSLAPGDEDFSDLQPLKQVIGDSRVVLLGEQTHGDGTVFLAKTRLIKFLHQEMGFDVLAFESGLYDCRKAWDRLRAGEDPVTAVKAGVFGIWTLSEQVQPLIAYLGERARAERPLELAGFDCQFTGSASHDTLLTDLEDYLRRIGSSAPDGERWKAASAIIQNLAVGAYEMKTVERPRQEEQDAFYSWLDELRAEIASRAPRNEREAAFWRQLLESTASFARTDWLNAEPVGAAIGERDRQMGRNLVWLANERYRGRKIVVWAATFHNARHLGTLEPDNEELRRLYQGFQAMGEVAWETLGKDMYSLGFTAYEGKAARVFARQEPEPLPLPSRGSLEDLMHRAGLENAIVDFRNPPPGGEWLKKPLVSRPLGYSEMRGDWSQVLDGMMYIRVMSRSTAIRKETK